MLTDLDHISTRRPTFGHRSSALTACSLPDSQALLELSLREIETSIDESHSKLQALSPQLSVDFLRTHEQVDRARHDLQIVCVGYSKHLKVIQERLVARHHSQGRFGPTIGRQQAELAQQIERLHVDQQQLGELSAEQSLELVAQRMMAIVAKLRAEMEQLNAIIQAVRQSDRQPHSITLGSGPRMPQARNQVRDQLAWSLRRWWQTCTVQPGPMTIAVIDLHRLATDCPGLSRAAVAELLHAAASLIVSDRRTGRAGITIDTTVISAEGDERYLAWSCAVIEDQKSEAQSIIAAGLDKTSSTPAKVRAKQSTAISAAAFSLGPTPVGEERRRKQRNPFPYVQLIAPYTGTGLPPTSAFFEVLCYDISEDGFSFLSAAMPTATSLVIALGTRPPHLYMTARVAHFTRCDTVSGAKYIVGCQFTGRAMVMAQFA